MIKREIKPRNYVAYGLCDVLGAGSMAVISGWLIFFYTTFCGLSAVEAASIFAIARILDAVASPLIGHISDNLGKTRIGRRFGRRRFFLLAAIPLLPSFAFMWVSGQHYWYYLLTFVFFELVYASVLIPYETLAAEMTDDYTKKAKFAGARILVGQISAIFAGILPAWIVNYVGGDENATTFLIMGGIFAVTFMCVVAITYFFTWEREPVEEPDVPDKPKTSAFASLKMVFVNLGSTLRIRAFRLHLGMYLGGYISQDIFNAAFTYFIVFALGGSVAIASSLIANTYIAQLIAVMLAITLVIRIGPAFTYRIAVIFYLLGISALLTLFLMFSELPSMYWLLGAVVLAGLGRGALNYIPWNVYNYIPDVDQIVTAKRREGSFAGVMTFIRKAAQAVAVMAVGIVLEWGGFTSGSTTQSTEAINTIVFAMVVGPLILLLFGFWVAGKFKLNKDTHELLMQEIAHLKTGATEPSSEHSRKVVEDLSGWPYEKLWGKNSVGK
ncbi:MFS transporter [Cellvibrio polysaccharolyticus]|uniref:MFS transporter n=1 Tax=Cellvibrio polysaccharolyticus TaxID=2082724 RepID=A0A928YTN5_9GAMM|nr:MFS transporter [Cellvibrio polysaccharolyticus]MBE8717042.1 MFS transporter [Cellvibrio polysaccharolyticus]